MSDPRYPYQNLRPAAISVAQLDQLMEFVVNSPKGTFGAIVAAVKLAAITAYVIAREKLAASEAEYTKQQYEVGRAGSNQSEVDKIGQRKPPDLPVTPQ